MKQIPQRLLVFLPAVLAITIILAPAPAVSAAPAAPEASVEDLRSLARDIEDEPRRKELLANIRALIAARRGTAGEAGGEIAGGGFIAALSRQVKETTAHLAAAADSLSELPVLAQWLQFQFSDAQARRRWMAIIFKLALIFAAGLIGEHLARRLLERPRRELEGQEAENFAVRALMLTARTLLDVVPIAVFAAAAYLVLPLTGPEPEVQVVALTFVNAYLIARGILVAARMLLVPAAASLRLLTIGDETANYLFIWTRRLVAVAVFGYFLAEAARLLGLPQGGHGGLIRLVGLLVAGLGIVFILQNRAPVAGWLGGDGDETPLGMGRLRRRLADIWHAIAIIYVAGAYGVWAMDVEGGFEFLARATVLTAAILAAARLITLALGRAVDKGFAVGADVKARFPALEARANRYLPVLHRILKGLVYALAALALLQTWGIDMVAWLDSPFGRRLGEGVFSIAVVVVAALLVWEGLSAAVEKHLNRTGEDGIEASARARTLLPLLRNAVMVVLYVLVTLIVLSELGVDIGPLLAGAGVVGLAVGFGAQKLVQDVITGFFILIEDTIAVGDIAKLGGHGGVVEAISIRSIRLRDYSGQVHTIPFSSVDTVVNMTKDFSYYVFKVGVAYREDVDQVIGLMEEIGAELEADPEHGPNILEPLQVSGLDAFADSAVMIKARIKTKPIMQWSVGREFNRRMKKRFDAEGIEIPFPHTTVYFGEDKDGEAPPARFAMDPEARPVQAKKSSEKGDGED